MIASIKKTTFHRDVYEPAEDSFALVDALVAHREAWRERPPRLCLEVGCGSGYVVYIITGCPNWKTQLNSLPHRCLEVGCGSGYVICSLALLLRELGIAAQLLATDINPQAAAATRATLAAHEVAQRVDVLLCDLASALLPAVEGQVDLLVFNPPYVPTPDEEVSRGGIAAAWAGGARGRRVTDRLLPLLPRLLSPRGEAFLVAVHENDPPELMRLTEAAGFEARIALQRKADEEVLTILHFWRRPSADGGRAAQQQQEQPEQQQTDQPEQQQADQPERQQREPSHPAAADQSPRPAAGNR